MPTPWGNDFRVNATIGGNQNQPSITVLSDGRQVVAWRDEGVNTATLRFSILNTDGSVALSDGLLNTSQTGTIGQFAQGQFQVAALDTGGFVAAWNQNSDVRFRAFDANGNQSAAEAAITHLDPSNIDRRPAVVGIAGGFEIAWVSSNKIYKGLFGNNGTPVFGALASDTLAGDDTPSLAYDSTLNGDVLVWQDSFGPNSNGGIWGKRGATLFRADDLTTGQTNGLVSVPEVAFDGNHNFLTVWLHRVIGAPTVTYNISGNLGTTGSRFQINTDSIGGLDAAEPQVVGLSTGGWLVVWLRPTVNSFGEIHGQVIAANGSLSGSEFVIGNTATYTGLSSLDAVAMPDGRVLVTWEGTTSGSTGQEIYTRYVDLRTGPETWTGTSAGEHHAGTVNADSLRGAGGNDYTAGGDGDDTISGGAGNNTINGGNGIDTVDYAGTKAQFTITRGPNGTTTITGLGISDTIRETEFARFTDQTVNLTTKVEADFNGDGKADLFAKDSGGSLAVWLTDGQTLVGGGYTSIQPGPAWEFLG
jgi:RTX calcium-binding nonapeptide repeat (4 copies)